MTDAENMQIVQVRNRSLGLYKQLDMIINLEY